MIDDMCKFISDFEANPEAIVSGITVRDYLMMREHLISCDACYLSVERVRSKYPDEPEYPTDLISKN